MPWKGIGVAIAVIVASLIVLGRASGFVVDWAWFSTIGYVGVFWTVFATKAVLFTAVFAVSTLLLWVNGTLAFRFASQRRLRLPAALDPASRPSGHCPRRRPSCLDLRPAVAVAFAHPGVALVLGLLIAMGETGNWDLILRFIHQVPYGQRDPLFGKDIGFYLFSLPVYVALKNWMLLILVLSALIAGAVYFVHGDINLDRRPWRISSAAIAHGSALLGLFFAVKAWSYALDRFLLLYDDNGVVVGAGYTDVHVELPVLWVLVGLAAAAAVVAWANVRLRTYRLAIAAAVLVFGSSFVFAVVFPAVFQRFYVKPNELQLEAPYIQRNIALTQEAYNLRQITVKPFPAEQGLTFQSLQDNRATIDNIRLWDWQPLMDTYAQLQEIRTYYKFHDVDVDRYELDGSYQQVMLSARELEPSLLSANAQTWVNLHLLFTHGNGVVMSPVTQKSAEGLPIFYLKDIPPVASGGPRRHRAAHLFRTGRQCLRDRQGQHAGVRLSQGKGQRLRELRRRGRGCDRWDRLEDAVRLVFRRPEHPAQPLHHRREPDPVPSQHPGSRADDRPVSAPRSRSLHGDQRRAALLDARRLHHEQLVPLRPAATRWRHQLHPQFGQGRHRRLQRDRRLLCRRSRRSDRRDLPAHLPRAVQAVRGDAGGSAKAHPLPGGPLPHPGPAVPRLPHGCA